MISTEQITSMVTAELAATDLYVVEVTISSSKDIEILLDSDTRVCIDQCATLSRAIDTQLEEAGEDDYSLLVASWGIGNTLKMDRQYTRCVGNMVEVLLLNSKKITAELVAYDQQNRTITIAYEEKMAVEGKKRKELVKKEETLPLTEIKSVREALTIK